MRIRTGEEHPTATSPALPERKEGSLIVLRSPRRPRLRRLRWLIRWLWWTVVPIVVAGYAIDDFS